MNRKEEKRDPESIVRDIRRNTRWKFSADEKIRMRIYEIHRCRRYETGGLDASPVYSVIEASDKF